jgi:segregation and condensation protein A
VEQSVAEGESASVASDESGQAGPSAPADAAAASAAVATAGRAPGPAATEAEPEDPSVFRVHLAEFQGPFDLLLSLIAKHKLDVTTLALSQVTDDFIAYIRAQGPDWDLDAASEFLLIAATLLDLKAARLLPSAEVEDEEDLALLEARDLLFARLLQYRAYKQVAATLAERYAHGSLRHPRSVPLEPEFRDLLPELVFALTPEQFAKLAIKAMTPKVPPQVSIAHIHQIQVSVREQAALVVERLRVLRTATFQQLVQDAPDTLHVVARFLALLELFRERAVGFEQDQNTAYAELTVHWTGDDTGDIDVDGEFDEGDGAAAPRDGAPAAPRQERADFADITELTGIAESEYGDQEDES